MQYDNTPRKRRNSKSKTKSGKAGNSTTKKADDSDYESGDKRIIELTQQGYKPDYIASKLAQEGKKGRTAKQVASRWLRLKKKVEAQEDQRLDDELSDWHLGEVSACCSL